jgi:acetyl esterase/lipase
VITLTTAVLSVLVPAGEAAAQSKASLVPAAPSVQVRRDAVHRVLAARACDALTNTITRANVKSGLTCGAPSKVVTPGRTTLVATQTASLTDGTLVGRQRIAASGTVALDIVSYASDGLIVGGLLCYPDDGRPHSTVIHVHGGLDGVFSPPGDLVKTCIDWAALHGRTAFAPSLRGEDGGEGRIELCLGETDDLVNAATMLRTLETTDPARVAIVGGSIGACAVLGAAPRIPNLAAVVAFVPPIAWKELVQYHRTQWSPATETRCDGSTALWNIGGPPMADVFDSLICGHAACLDSEYIARSPLRNVSVQAAPTLIVTAESDNVVPFGNQVLWSWMRRSGGATVTPISVDPCDPPGTPPALEDVLIVVRSSFHLLSPSAISSGMLFLMARLDERGTRP